MISEKQGISLIFLFIVGSSSIFAQGLEAKKDLWLAFILGILMALPMSIIYGRIYYIFPKKICLMFLKFALEKSLEKY